MNTRGNHARVRYFPDSESLTRVPVPTGGVDENDSYYIPLDAGRLRLIECVDFPFWVNALMPEAFRSTHSDLLYSLAPVFLPTQIESLEQQDPNGDCVFHKLLGYQPGMNSGPESEEEHGRFFFSFGSRYGGEQWWGESGQPFVFIRPEDLAANRFDSLYLQPG